MRQFGKNARRRRCDDRTQRLGLSYAYPAVDMVTRIAIDDSLWQRRDIAISVIFAPYGAIRSGLAGSAAVGRRSSFSYFSATTFLNRQTSKDGGSST